LVQWLLFCQEKPSGGKFFIFAKNRLIVKTNIQTMLGLKLPTDPRWVNLAEMDLEEILTDHAYCELKAATSCISLVQSYPEKIELVEQVTPVVTEEWGHFRLVLKELKKRGLSLGKQRKDEYVNELLAFQDKNTQRENRLVEKLLTCALIEARSCERFRLLSENISDPQLQKFYRDFMIAEANHYVMFLDLAKKYGSNQAYVLERWQQYLNKEAEIMQNLSLRGDRMH
jgi:tRNA 2-(methylsulfanyl)-N6-isopentenyladenosine37 hydroxylase